MFALCCIRPERIDELNLPDLPVVKPQAAREKFNKSSKKDDIMKAQAGRLTPQPPGVEVRSNDRLPDVGKDESKLHLIVDMSRVGANLFSVRMEYTYFPPRSGRNYLFELIMVKWPFVEGPLASLAPPPRLWAVLSFPIEYKAQAEVIAKECGLRVADGIPTMISGDGVEHFPMDGKTVFTLENIEGHRVYENDRQTYERLKEQERQECDRILEADRNKLVQEMRSQGYTQQQVDRILAHWDLGDESYEEKPELAADGQHRHKTL